MNRLAVCFIISEMEDKKFELLMSKLHVTREKFDASIAEVKREVVIAQERIAS